jgi:hypothetical protein
MKNLLVDCIAQNNLNIISNSCVNDEIFLNVRRGDFYIIYLAMKEKVGRKVMFFPTYDPLTVTHLFQRFSNKAMP